MLHGTADSPADGGVAVTNIQMARDFEAKLRAAGKPVEAVYYEGGRHNDIFASQEIMRAMLEMSKCPDLVINKGHYFGTSLMLEEPGLSDDAKRDLIGFLKTL